MEAYYGWHTVLTTASAGGGAYASVRASTGVRSSLRMVNA